MQVNISWALINVLSSRHCQVFIFYRLKIVNWWQDVKWVVVSTHTRSLALISAGLKTRDNLFQETSNIQCEPWLRMYEHKKNIPFSWMTLHTWFGLSVKCLVIRSPPDASTRRSQLRQTSVNLGESNSTSCLISNRKHYVCNTGCLWSVLTLMQKNSSYDPFSKICFWLWCYEI